MAVILIEGPDCSGKTTLCCELMLYFLKNKKKTSYIHINECDNKPEGIKKQLLFYKFNKNNNVNVIVDRAHWSNYVYSRVFGGYMMNDYDMKKMNSVFDKIVVCLPENKNLYLKKFNDVKKTRFELYEDMTKVYDLYDYLLSGKNSLFKRKNVFRYDMFNCSTFNVDDYINKLLEDC